MSFHVVLYMLCEFCVCDCDLCLVVFERLSVFGFLFVCVMRKMLTVGGCAFWG